MRTLIQGLAGVLLVLAVVVYAASHQLSSETLKQQADAMAYFGGAEGFAASFFDSVLARMRVFALCLAGFAVAVWLGRHRIATAARAFSHTFREDLLAVRPLWEWKQEPAHYRRMLCGLMVMAALTRLPFLFQPIRYDEAHTFLHYASRPLYVGLAYYDEPNNHVLNTFLVHVTAAVMGESEWSLRLPAFIFGVLMIPAAYQVARQLYDRRTALLSAGLLACSSAMAEYATNARGYTLMIFLFLVGLAFSTRMVERKNTVAWTGFVLCSALGFYAIPLMLYPFLATVVWLWISRRAICREGTGRSGAGKDVLFAVPATLCIAAVLYSPVFVVSGVDALVQSRYVQPLPWHDLMSQLPASLVAAWHTWHRDIPRLLEITLLLSAFVGTVGHRRIKGGGYPLFAVTAIVVACMLGCHRVAPPPRAFLFVLPLYLMSASAGIVWLAGRAGRRVGRVRAGLWPAVVLALSFLISMRVVLYRSVLESRETGFAPDAHNITRFLKQHTNGEMSVAARVPAISPLIYYFRRYGIPIETLKERLSPDHSTIVVVNEASGQELASTIRLLTPEGEMPPFSVIPLRAFPSAALYWAAPHPHEMPEVVR